MSPFPFFSAFTTFFIAAHPHVASVMESGTAARPLISNGEKRMPIVNVAGLRAAAAAMAWLLLPAAAAGCEMPLRIAWPADRAP
ncbi:hypothetical protein, partial [Stenotrophomonas sp.]|uniref:hypothetical protein n=1 Tax=Stenotrophomonas sp. TaxID=69392 RepID=UPI00289F07B5